eukprot:GHVT01090188.1.p1 GENE.GHVT01090188.1~~GHVT01090188.1.p1  ORF type:complete len:142 (-),score=2.21 GHVT01090188.1:492-917(-)
MCKAWRASNIWVKTRMGIYYVLGCEMLRLNDPACGPPRRQFVRQMKYQSKFHRAFVDVQVYVHYRRPTRPVVHQDEAKYVLRSLRNRNRSAQRSAGPDEHGLGNRLKSTKNQTSADKKQNGEANDFGKHFQQRSKNIEGDD